MLLMGIVQGSLVLLFIRLSSGTCQCLLVSQLSLLFLSMLLRVEICRSCRGSSIGLTVLLLSKNPCDRLLCASCTLPVLLSPLLHDFWANMHIDRLVCLRGDRSWWALSVLTLKRVLGWWLGHLLEHCGVVKKLLGVAGRLFLTETLVLSLAPTFKRCSWAYLWVILIEGRALVLYFAR
jgi:hypothetical protein